MSGSLVASEAFIFDVDSIGSDLRHGFSSIVCRAASDQRRISGQIPACPAREYGLPAMLRSSRDSPMFVGVAAANSQPRIANKRSHALSVRERVQLIREADLRKLSLMCARTRRRRGARSGAERAGGREKLLRTAQDLPGLLRQDRERFARMSREMRRVPASLPRERLLGKQIRSQGMRLRQAIGAPVIRTPSRPRPPPPRARPIGSPRAGGAPR